MICSVILLVLLRVGYLVLFHLCSQDDVIHQNLSRITGACSHEPWFCFNRHWIGLWQTPEPNCWANSQVASDLRRHDFCRMTLCSEILFRITVPVWWEFIGHRYIPIQKASHLAKIVMITLLAWNSFFNKHSSCWWCDTPWRHMLLLWWKLGSPRGNHGCRFSFRCSQWGSN